MTHSNSSPPPRTNRILTVVLVYAVFSSLWILLSDRAVAWLFSDAAQFALVSTIKGWFFVGVTSLLLFALMRRLLQHNGVAPDDVRLTLRTLRLPLALVFVAILCLVAGAIDHTLQSEKAAQGARLQAIAELKAHQIADWLKERHADAEFVRTSRLYAENFGQWRGKGDDASRDALQSRLDRLGRGGGFRAALILDEAGELLWDSSGAMPPVEPALRAAAREGAAAGRVGQLGPYRDAQGHLYLDFIAPLSAVASGTPAVVLRVDPADHLYPALLTWPAPTETGETLLFRRDGGRLLYLSTLRHAPDAAARVGIPAAEVAPPASHESKGQVAASGLVEAIDYRGVTALGVIRAIPGTDWFILAKIDRAEAYRAAASSALWIGFAGLLALFAAWGGLFLFRQRQELATGQREHALQAERLRALSLLDAIATSSDDAIFAKDLDGRYLLFNRAAEGFTGKAAADVLGRDDHFLFPAEQAAVLMSNGKQAMAENRILTAEEVLATAAGERTFLATKGPLHDAQGRVIGLFGISRDITERKRAEARLRASELRFRKLLNEIPTLAVQGYGPDSITHYWNHASERLYGYTAAEAIGRSLLELIIPPDMRDHVRHSIQQMFETGQPIAAGELSLTRKDGSRVAVYSCHAIVQVPGQAPEMFCLDIDLTERKRAEEQLRKLSLAVEQSQECVVITNLDAQIEYVNDAFVRVTGYSREEVTGQNPRILQSGTTPRQTYEDLWAALTRGEPWKGEFHNRRKNGEEYVEYATITPIRQPDGRLTHYVAIKDDMTEKRRLSDELDRYRHHLEELVAERTAQLADARARAEAANLAKSAFLANMSHEIRTPMNGIVGLTHLLQQSELTPAQAQRLGKIETAAHHLLAIINDILDLSKIEAGRLELERTDFDLEAVFDHVRSLVAEQAQARGLAIDVRPGDVPRWLRGDATRLRQALLNYAGNAVKFTEHGTVSMRAQLAEDRGQELLIRFEVEDSGVGIAPDVLPRLFEAFEQADVSTTRQHGGSGLGLAITRRLASLMGGQAGVQSEPGRGSLFWFTARLDRGQPVLAPDIPSAVPAGRARESLRRYRPGAKILLVEDNAINREVALELLRAVDLAVDTAEDGIEAVEEARREHYDLILMDMQMPRMDGLSAARAIREIPGYARIPILAMTANAFGEDRAACLAAGMNDHIVKPVDPESFYAVLLKYLSGGSAAGADAVAAAPASEANRACLEAISGLDVAAGLRFSGGNWAFYTRLLQRLAEHHAADVARVRENLGAGDMAEARRVAHSLKGISATLGAGPLQAAIAAVEKAIAIAPESDQKLNSQCDAAESELSRLVAALRACLG